MVRRNEQCERLQPDAIYRDGMLHTAIPEAERVTGVVAYFREIVRQHQQLAKWGRTDSAGRLVHLIYPDGADP